MFDLTNDALEPQIIIKRISADSLTPIKILSQMNAVALLESAYVETGKSRYYL